MQRPAARLARLVLCAPLALLASCAPYALQGKVVEGDISYVAIVDASDPRLSGPGLPNAQLTLHLDPESLNRELAGQTLSAPDGSFSIPVGSTGAGFLQYDASLAAEAGGFLPAQQTFPLPPSGKRALVMLRRGQGKNLPANETLYEQFQRFNR